MVGAALALAAALAAAPLPGVGVDDQARVRHLDALTVSPDGSRYAVFVRSGDPDRDAFDTGWLVGRTDGGPAVRVGDGGELRPRVMPTGHTPGLVQGGPARWSPDGHWIAYAARRDGEVQLWRGAADGGPPQQLTRGEADVLDFRWTADGRALVVGLGPPRAEIAAAAEARGRSGYRFDEDFWSFGDLLGPQLVTPPPAVARVQVVEVGGGLRDARPDERALLEAGPDRTLLALAAQAPVACPPPDCDGQPMGAWRAASGDLILWRTQGLGGSAHAVYGWRPGATRARRILLAPDDQLSDCAPAAGERLLCVRESAARPQHLVAIDLKSGRAVVVADPNETFARRALGRVERIEWDTPRFAWNAPGGALAGLYPSRAFGYVIYPPDFDPKKTYPVFVDPYVPGAFDPVGAEHALHAYAAAGMVVLRTGFPMPVDEIERFGSGAMARMYDPGLGYPHMTMLAESTLAGLDTLGRRGFVDLSRVGIGGVSHGTFVPLYMMQRHDRIAAISISSPAWGPFQHYGITARARRIDLSPGFGRDPDVDPDYYRRIDPADHVEALEAPILMHLAAHETFAVVRLIRKLADAGRPYDAYVFAGETHLKWRPAHRAAILQRNLDWFRFWLQDAEDPDPAKAGQYAKWRALRAGR